MKKNSGNAVVWLLIIIGGLVWLIFFRGGDKPNYDSYSGDNPSIFGSKEECIEPENSYSYGSGHYAGFEWGENGNSCGGNSDSFIEGCEDYESQESIYQNCINK